MIRAVRMPLFVHALRTLVRNVLVLAHNVVVIVAVDIIFAIKPGWCALMALPGVAVWAVDTLAIALLLGAFCARFRDITPIVASVMQIAFFLTPVLWLPGMLGRHAVLVTFNPFYALLEIVRAPFLGHHPIRRHLAICCPLQPGIMRRIMAAVCACPWARGVLDVSMATRITHRRPERLGFLSFVSRQQPQPEENGHGGCNRTAWQGSTVSNCRRGLARYFIHLEERRSTGADRRQRRRQDDVAAGVGGHLRAGNGARSHSGQH